MAFNFNDFEAGLESLMIEPYELGYDPINDAVDAALEAYFYGDEYDDEDDIAEEGIKEFGAKIKGAAKDFKDKHTWSNAIPQGEIKAKNIGAGIQKMINSLMNQIDKVMAKLENMSRSKRGNRTIYLTPLAQKAFKMIDAKDGAKIQMNAKGELGEKQAFWHNKKAGNADDSTGQISPETISQSYMKVNKHTKYNTISAEEMLRKINGLRATARNLKTRVANLKNDSDNQVVASTGQLIKRLNNDANTLRAIMRGSDSISAGTYKALPNTGQRDVVGMKQTGKAVHFKNN